MGKGDVSFSGPFSDPGIQVQNYIAIPLSLVFGGWARWAYNGAKADGSTLDGKHWGRYLLPVVFLGIGWMSVWPKFFQKDQFDWPDTFVGLWIFIFWSETSAGIASAA